MRLFFSRIPADHSLGEVALLGVCEVGEESRKGFLFQPQLSAVLKSSETSWEASQPGLQAPRALPTHHGLLTPPPCSLQSACRTPGPPGAFQAQPFQASFHSWKPPHLSLTSRALLTHLSHVTATRLPISIPRCFTLSLLCPPRDLPASSRT